MSEPQWIKQGDTVWVAAINNSMEIVVTIAPPSVLNNAYKLGLVFAMLTDEATATSMINPRNIFNVVMAKLSEVTSNE